MRRSAVFEKSMKTKKNGEVFMVEVTSSSSIDSVSTSSLHNLNCSYKIMNETPIVVVDSDSSTSNLSEKEIIKVNPFEKMDTPAITNCVLSDRKMKDINFWLDGINEKQLHEVTKYSELSTIYGDEGGNFQAKASGNVFSSTLIGSQKRVDNFLKRSVEVNEDNDLPLFIVEDSFEIRDKETKPTPLNSSKCVISTNINQKTPTCMLWELFLKNILTLNCR